MAKTFLILLLSAFRDKTRKTLRDLWHDCPQKKEGNGIISIYRYSFVKEPERTKNVSLYI
jgi:hypothetical protein